jgi:fibronectin type 3 domain-containing protein
MIVLCIEPFSMPSITGAERYSSPIHGPDQPPTPEPDKEKSDQSFSLEGFFTENLGQLGEGAGRYYALGNPLSVAFGPGWVAYRLLNEKENCGTLFRINFEDSNVCEPVGKNGLSHTTSYFIGNDSKKWVTGACSYRELEYPDLWEGVCLRYYFLGPVLKYEFVVRPGIDPSTIRLAYEGVDRLSIGDDMELSIHTSTFTLCDEAPVAFQDVLDVRINIPCRFQLLDYNCVAFEIGSFDGELPIVIDPGLEFSTFLGGDDGERSIGIFVDDSGCSYISGDTSSSNFPTMPGSFVYGLEGLSKIFITKLSADGSSLVYSVIIGSELGISCRDMFVDPEDCVYIAGHTSSSDFPTTEKAYDTTHNGGRDVFILKLDASGSSLVYSTLLGGGIDDWYSRVCVDDSGFAYVTGNTNSSKFPTTDGAFCTTISGGADVFVSKLNRDGSDLVYSTLVGGKGYEWPGAIELDDTGRAYVTGSTNSPDFPTVEGMFCSTYNRGWDAFLLKLDATGASLVYSTLLGGSYSDEGYDLCLGEDGSAYIAGGTTSRDFPTTIEAYDPVSNIVQTAGHNGFLCKVNPNGTSLIFSTFIEGFNQYTFPREICIDELDSIYIIGDTSDRTLPTTREAYNPIHRGASDVFTWKLDDSGSLLLYSSYLGSSTSDAGSSIFVAESDQVYLTGTTWGSNFPTTTNAFDRKMSGRMDAFVSKLNITDDARAPPSAPQNFSLESGNGSVTLTWNPPSDDGGAPLRGYRIYKGKSADGLKPLVELKTPSEIYNDTDVVNGRTYYYAMTAFNVIGQSPRTPVLKAVPSVLPTAPLDLTAIAGTGNVGLSWSPPLDTGGLPILGYRIYRGDTKTNLSLVDEVGNVTLFMDSNVENGRFYLYRVQAFHVGGGGDLSNIARAQPYGPPSAPWGLKAEPGDGRVKLTWNVPASDGGGRINGYQLYRGQSLDSLERYLFLNPASSHFDKNVINGRRYFYAVAAVNVYGEGPMSLAVNATPLGPSDAPRDLAVEEGDGHVTLTWDPPGDTGGAPILSYRVYRGPGMDMQHLITGVENATVYVDTDLENGKRYYFRVCALTHWGEGISTGIVTAVPMGWPSEPEELQANPGIAQVEIVWLPPRENGGSDIAGYRIYRGELPEAPVLLAEVEESSFRYLDVKVVCGITYHYRIAALNLRYEGPPSVIVAATPIGIPGAPVDLTATSGDCQVMLNWKSPINDGGRRVLGYNVYMLNPELLPERIFLGHVENKTGFDAVDLEAGVTYQFIVTAVNEVGEGLGVMESAIPLGRPTAPKRVTARVENGTVVLAWEEPLNDGGSPITGYVVLRGKSETDLTQFHTIERVATFTDRSVRPGAEYYYSIKAINALGEGPPSNVVCAQLPDDDPEFSVRGGFIWIVIIIIIIGSAVVMVVIRRHSKQ